MQLQAVLSSRVMVSRVSFMVSVRFRVSVSLMRLGTGVTPSVLLFIDHNSHVRGLQ